MPMCRLCQSEVVDNPKRIMCSSCHAGNEEQARAAGYFLFGGIWSAAHGKRDPAWDLTLRPDAIGTQNCQLPREFILSKAFKKKETCQDKNSSDQVEASFGSALRTLQPQHAGNFMRIQEEKRFDSSFPFDGVENLRKKSQKSPGPGPGPGPGPSPSSVSKRRSSKTKRDELGGVAPLGHGILAETSNQQQHSNI